MGFAVSKERFFTQEPIFDTAIIISVLRYKDSDCIVKLLSQKHGKLTAFLKSGAKVTKKNMAIIQAPSIASISFLLAKNEEMSKIVSFDLDFKSYIFATSPRILGLCSYLCEIVEIFLPSFEPCEKIFDLCLETFPLFSSHKNTQILLRSFELKLLDYAGYLPNLTDTKAAIEAYDHKHGVFTDSFKQNFIEFSNDALNLANTLFTKPMMDLPLEAGQKELLMVAKIFHSRLKSIHPKPLKSILFLKSLSS